jgi:GxxExxY protein
MDTHYRRWSREEEEQMIQLADNYVCKIGIKKWEAIAAQMGGRRTATALQARYMALKKMENTDPPELVAVVPAEPEPEPAPVPAEESNTEAMNTAFKDIREMARRVAAGLGKGRAESVYQHAMGVELQEKKVAHTMEEVITISYNGVTVGHERADIHIYCPAFPSILEMKATNCPIQPKEHWQVISYMRALKRSFGAVINFNQSQKGQLQMDCLILADDGKPYIWDPDTSSITGEPLSDYTEE